MLVRCFLVLFGLILLCNLCCAQSTDQPNIILIITDDQRWDALGHAGNDIVQTPHMDSLARQSTYFENAFVTTPICAASRASILTGLYERSHDYTFGTPPLQSTYIKNSYPALLKKANYNLGYFGKLGVNFENRLDTVVFDKIRTEGTHGYFRLTGKGGRHHIHLTDLTTDRAIEYIDTLSNQNPFCVTIGYNAPHADDASVQQYFWPERNDHLYRDVDIPLPTLHQKEYFSSLPPFVRDSMSLSVARWHWRFDSPRKYQEMVKGYYRMISTIDDNLGKLRRYLEQEGLADNTIIILLGDNGYFLGERSLAGKWLMYDNSLRVPLMIYDPKRNGKSYQGMTLNIDIAPTILSLAGVEIPDKIQGLDLTACMDDPTKLLRDEFICEHLFDIPYIPKSEGIRTNQWKYFRYLDHPDSEELYDLKVDPLEKNNLADDPIHQNILRDLRSRTNKKLGLLDKY